MVKSVLVTFILIFHFTGTANHLQSDALRKMICKDFLFFLEEEGFSSTIFDEVLNKEIETLPGFFKSCQTFKKSFEVVEPFFNEKAKTITKLPVSINLLIKGLIHVQGQVLLARQAFDPDSGEISLKKWEIKKNSYQFSLKEKAIQSLAAALLATASIEGGYVKQYEDNLSRNDVLKMLNKQLFPEDELDEERCHRTPVDSHEESTLLNEAEGYSSYSMTRFKSLYKFAKKYGLVVDVYGSGVEEYSEYCAYYDIFIQLKKGIFIELFYDQTT